MKKLVYILVAVFTMISVNANAASEFMTVNLHYCYPGCSTDKIHDFIFTYGSYIVSFNYDKNDKWNNYFTLPSGAVVCEVEHFNFPTCKGYKFVGFFAGEKKVISPEEDSKNYYIDFDNTENDLYGKWERDTKNYEWTNDYNGAAGFFEYKWGDVDWDSFRPWTYMMDIDDATTTSINEVEATSHNTIKEGIYTLNGVKVENITKSGIYIINGKKVVK